MKKTIAIIFAVLALNVSCTMDGADNPANSAESDDNTGADAPGLLNDNNVTNPGDVPVNRVDSSIMDTSGKF